MTSRLRERRGKSKGELKADALLEVIQKGRANTRQAGDLLGVHYNTIRARIARGKIRVVRPIGTSAAHITIGELLRCGLALPPLPAKLQERLRYHLENDPLKDEIRDTKND